MPSTMRFAAIVCAVVAMTACKTTEDYRIRHHVSDAINLLSKSKVWATEHFLQYRKMPASNAELHLPEPNTFVTASIKRLEVLPDGSLMATLQDASGYKDATIRFIPEASNFYVGSQWTCVSAEIADISTWLSNCHYRPR